MNYKDRFKKEYKELKERYNKLHRMLVKYYGGTLDFEFDTPEELLVEQEEVMLAYLKILEVRAEYEQIDLDESACECNIDKELSKALDHAMEHLKTLDKAIEELKED